MNIFKKRSIGKIIKTYTLGDGTDGNPYCPAIAEKYDISWTDVGHPSDARMLGIFTIEIDCNDETFEKIKMDDTVIPFNLTEHQTGRSGKHRLKSDEEILEAPDRKYQNKSILNNFGISFKLSEQCIEWSCDHCDSVNKTVRGNCQNCGAPRTVLLQNL